jgi:hypothetical protein
VARRYHKFRAMGQFMELSEEEIRAALSGDSG